MTLGIGTDIIEVARIATAIKRHGQRFLDKVFTVKEQMYCLQYGQPERHFAGRFAAKEAVVKAMGTGLRGAKWTDIEILNDDLGKPYVHLCDDGFFIEDNQKILISISHCHSYATAVAIHTTRV